MDKENMEQPMMIPLIHGVPAEVRCNDYENRKNVAWAMLCEGYTVKIKKTTFLLNTEYSIIISE
jgi:hypothetical protein